MSDPLQSRTLRFTKLIPLHCSPYKFEAPWTSWEFAYHVLHYKANLVMLSMAWLTQEDARSFSRTPQEPDMDTLSYWLSRLEPLIRADITSEIIVVLANRTGSEGDATYAGTSAVLGIHQGEVKVYGLLGRGERSLLVSDTEREPFARFVSQPRSDAALSQNARSTTAEATTDLNSQLSKDGTAHSPTSAAVGGVEGARPASSQ